jgi:hypothetical protein
MRLALGLRQSSPEKSWGPRTIESLTLDEKTLRVKIKGGTVRSYPLESVLSAWIESDAANPQWECRYCGNRFSLIDGKRTVTKSIDCSCAGMPITVRLAREAQAKEYPSCPAAKIG